MTEPARQQHLHSEAVESARKTIVTLRVPAWLDALGSGSWLILGLIALTAVALLLLGVISSLLIPLVTAAVIGAIIVPLVDVRERWHIRRWLGAALVLLLGLAIVMAVVALVVRGVVQQADAVTAQAAAGTSPCRRQRDFPSGIRLTVSLPSASTARTRTSPGISQA